jgi:chaperonin GroES
MSIVPANDRVLVKPLESKTAGGIVLTGTAAKKYLHGVVMAVGPGRVGSDGNSRIAISTCEVGDTVIYGNVLTTVEDTLDGDKVLLMQEAAIVGVIK